MISRKITKRQFIKSNILGIGGLMLGRKGLGSIFTRPVPFPHDKFFYADIHSHPTLKPIGKSRTQSNSNDPTAKNSIWHYGKTNFIEKATNLALRFADYSQSDLTEAIKGNVFLMGVSLYSPEVKFFDNKIGNSIFGKEFENFVSQFGEQRIKSIGNKNYDYFTDLEEQYKFLTECNGTEVTIKDKKYRYLLVKSYNELENALNEKEHSTIAITINIEGGHSFGPGKDPEKEPYPENKVIENIQKVKSWEFRPLYVTLSHHFYNELSGHTRSIPDELKKILDQSYGLNTGFTKTGMEAVKLLLNNFNNDRILLDVKHFSLKCRKAYYDLLDSDYSSENIPIIFSHGGVNGLKSFEMSGTQIQGSLFNEWDISLFDDEIVRIAKSKGIMGLNFDKRVMANDKYLKSMPVVFSRTNMLANWSKIIWNNIQHIGEICDKNNLPAWDNISLGTDYDGIINPIDGYWSFEELPFFAEDLLFHVNDYMKTPKVSSVNRIEPEELVEKIMCTNALEFYKRNLR